MKYLRMKDGKHYLEAANEESESNEVTHMCLGVAQEGVAPKYDFKHE
jgi:hypothetical protein